MLLINGAAGGLKQVLVDSKVTDEIVRLTNGLNLSPIVISFLVAAILRISLGSATISSVTLESTNTCFKPPAAPLISNTTAIVLSDWLSNGTILLILKCFVIINSIIAINKLIINAVIGLLIIVKIPFIVSDKLGIPKAIVGIVIKSTGNNINKIAKEVLIV